ncbi:MAG: CoA pyrophosphatase [Caldilineaceae bacterium]|nr:CoA pyrophosphatase [Caldilineaceae bacterium]
MNELFSPFIEQLAADLQRPLPGRTAQYRMAPQPRTGAGPDDTVPADARRGGVLVLFYPRHEQPYLPLILRPTYDGVHSGQVGFPGGGQEEGDPDIVATALREAQEEIGIDLAPVQLLGQLSPLYVFASNYLVQPTVAWMTHAPTFQIDPHEVAALIEMPLLALLDPANHRREQWQLRGRAVDVPFFQIQDYTIWGATAMMLSELLALSAISTLAPPTGGT